MVEAVAEQPAPIHHTTVELGDLISRYELGLVMLAGATEHTSKEPVQWVHGSDLWDPAQFLTPRTVLLTTGTQFAQDLSRDHAEQYVSRLVDARVSALGFAVVIVHERIPHEIIRACDQLKLPLFRVPFETPFIAISQTAARMIDAQSHAENLWGLEAQRAISVAALQTDGLQSAVRALSTRLGRWVAISDITGQVTHVAPASARQQANAAWLRDEVSALVKRGVRASVSRGDTESSVQLQTIGHGRHLHGALIVEGESTLNHAQQTAIGLVVTLATVQFDQRSSQSESEANLHSTILTMLVSGHTDAARKIAHPMIAQLPTGQLLIYHFGRADLVKSSMFAQLRACASSLQGALLGSVEQSLLMLVERRHMSHVSQFVETIGAHAGVSQNSLVSGLEDAVVQAELAKSVLTAKDDPPPGVTQYAPGMSEGVVSMLEHTPEALQRAGRLLAPLRDHDERHGDHLEETLQAWLAHHGQSSAAAANLGAHRHTVRNRVHAAATILQRDLDDPSVRADLWVALGLTSPDSDHSTGTA